jgi:hypothetical protein
MAFTPFCVADRPISLRILRGLDLGAYTGNVGIMIHANTSQNFQRRVGEYPLENGRCPFHNERHQGRQCLRVRKIRQRTIRMCDSGVFTKDGAQHSYESLFKVYERARVHYGIIIDHLRDAPATLKSARLAMEEYKRKPKRGFALVGVAQGKNPREYLACYAALRDMGYKHIAVGGLLNRRQNTARYVYVRGGRLFRILDALRHAYPRDWMFALGSYHPRRHDDLARYDMFGSDYKGWIFNYEERNDLGIIKARRSRIGQVRRFLQRHVYADTRKALAYRGQRKAKGALAVIACSKRKIWDEGHKGGALARDTYRGTLFKMATRFADKHLDDWVVLSGRHGFLSPGSKVPGPYNTKLPRRLRHRQTERLRAQVIQKGLHGYKRAVVFGGHDYANAAKVAFQPFNVEVVRPFPADAKIGTQLRRLSRATSLEALLATA